MKNIKGFAFKQGTSELLSREHLAFITSGYQCRSYNYKEEVPEEFIPAGTVEWCSQFLPKDKTTPDYYPSFLKKYLYRDVWYSNRYPNIKCFIKPADAYKRFNAYKYTNKPKEDIYNPPFWCSEIVKFKNEWRYYISNGKILTTGWYSGDEINTPDAPRLDITFPDTYCGAVDFGELEDGRIALVEAQAPFACGHYSSDHKAYIKWLIDGWNSLNA